MNQRRQPADCGPKTLVENLLEAYAKIRKAMGVRVSGLTGAVPCKTLNGRPGLQFGGTFLDRFSDRRIFCGTMELLACLVAVRCQSNVSG